MRTTFLRLALLGTAIAGPAFAQPAPAGSERTPPGATGSPSMTTAPAARGDAATPGAGAGATAPGAPTDRGQPAARIDSGTSTAAQPAAGANSFTEGQARSRIEAAGFTNISDLQKDDQGIWRGKASHGGQQVSVALDYQGNVSPPR